MIVNVNNFMPTIINLTNCGCLSGIITPGCPPPTTVPCATDCSDCMVVTSPVIQPMDSVGPCGKSATISLSTLNNYSICTGNVVHKLIDFDSTAFSSVTMHPSGDVVFVTTEDAVARQYYDITYKVNCISENVGGFGIIRVGIKDICNELSCTTQEVCDRCTETCIPLETNLSIGVSSNDGQNNNSNITLTTSSTGSTGVNLVLSVDSNK